MADTKTSALTAQTTVDPDDLLYAVDVSDTTMAASGTSKKATRESLQTYAAGTLTTDKKILDLSATWNAAGVTFTAIKANVTDTASNAASLLMDLQVGGTSKLKIDKNGFIAGPSVGFGFGPTAVRLVVGNGNTIYINGVTAGYSPLAFFYDGGGSNKYITIDSAASYQINNDTVLARDAANTLAQRNGTNAQESRVYASYTSATNFQRTSIKTVREVSSALSGASYTTTIAIPAYANLIGVTTRVTTAITGATTYDVGDGTDVDLWGAAIGIALGSQSRTADFTAVGAVGAAATSRTITLTANGSNFTGGVVEICAHYIFTEAD